jgi:hypothetical protein
MKSFSEICQCQGHCLSMHRWNRNDSGIKYRRSKKLSVIESLARSSDKKFSPELLKYKKVVGTPAENYLFYRQSFRGIPISDGWLRIDELVQSQECVGVHSRLLDDKAIGHLESKGATKPVFKEKGAIAKAKEVMGPTQSWDILDVQLCFRRPSRSKTTTPKLAWRIRLAQSHGVRSGEVYIDAVSGTRVAVHRTTWSSGFASGFVFRPNPLLRMTDNTLPDPKNLPRSSYREVKIPVPIGSRVLRNDFAFAWSPVSEPHEKAGEFFYEASDVRFGQTMALYYATWIQRYIRDTLQFKRANPGQVEFIVGFNREDNSYYDLQRNRVYLGLGGVPDYQDAEVILHEYAHGIHSVINHPFSIDEKSINLREGFCDYIALSVCEHLKELHPDMEQEFATWDAWQKGKTVGESRGLRRADDDDLLSDTQPVIHSSVRSDRASSFWTGLLWDLREVLLVRNTQQKNTHHGDSLALGALYKVDAPYTVENFAKAILLYNRSHWDGHKEREILRVFANRGVTVTF